MYLDLRMTCVMLVLLSALAIEARISGTAFCPERCICRKSDVPSITSGDTLSDPGSTIDVDHGWYVKCGGTDTNKIISIKEISFGEIEDQITHLDLSQNKISYLAFENFQNMTALRKLDLSMNSLRQLDESAFDEIKSLERLKLRNNQIEYIFQGTFDGLSALKVLDISENPLTCDCELLWLIPWSKNVSVRLQPKPICASPPPFKNRALNDLKLGSDLHCESPHQGFLEMTPNSSQLIFEGDPLTIRCRAPRVALGSARENEELPESPVFWGWSETIISESNQDIKFQNPEHQFPSIIVDVKYLSDTGLVDSTLRIPYTTLNHSGTWDCRLKTAHYGHALSRSVVVHVITNKTEYCLPDITRSNKGVYSWPKTIRGRTVNLPCQFDGGHNIYASYTCSKFGGNWEGLNITNCPYVSEATRSLEQFSKLDLTRVESASKIDSVKQLSNYTEVNIFQMDSVDVAFLTQTVEIYLEYISHDAKELGTILLDIISHIMRLNRTVLQRAQIQNHTSARLISAVEKIAYASPDVEPPRSNTIRLYRTSSERFSGIVCTSLRSKPTFDCVLPTNYNYLPFNEKTIEMSIQLPADIAVHSGSALEKKNLLITAYTNNNLFPQNQTKYLITSPVIGFSFKGKGILTFNKEPVHVMLRPKPYHDEKSTPIPVVWDQELGKWDSQGCTTIKASVRLVIFTCKRVGYYGLLQNINYLNDFENENAGQKFRLSPPGFYIGGVVLFFCCWINITTYAVAGRQIIMPRRIKHSLINVWLAISILVFVFSVGIYQTEDFNVCQIFGFALHYLCLTVLLWMCVTFSQLHKRILRRRSVLNDGERRNRQRKPISGLYFVGWGIGALICILSGAINVEEYATYHYCFLKPAPAVSALFVPALILFFVILVTIFRIKFTIRSREISARIAEATQMTENIDLDAIEPNATINRSVSSCTRTTHVDDQEHSLRAQVKSHIVVLLLILATWASAAIAVASPFTEYILYEEEIFSAIYAILATILGLFIVFFFGMSRSDVRLIWSTVNCGYKSYRGYSCRPANMINYKEYQEGGINAPTTHTAPTVVYQANISRSNSQSSKNHPITFSNGTMKEKEKSFAFLNRQQFVHNSVTGTIMSEPNNSEHMFYNPTQLHVARKFFRKQKRLQKQNNIEIQERRMPYDDTSSEISSMYGHHPPHDRMSMAMLVSGSKVNNTNISMNPALSYDKQFNHPLSCQTLSESENELFMNVCQDGLLQLGIGKGKTNNSTSQDTMKADDKYKRTALVDIQEEEERLAAIQKRPESPQYVNSPRRNENGQLVFTTTSSNPTISPTKATVTTTTTTTTTVETYFELEPPNSNEEGLILTLNSPVSASMNTVGLPCYQTGSSPSLKSSTDSLNTVRSPVKLSKGEAYVSAVLEITDQVTYKDGSIRVLEDSQPRDKARSLNHLTSYSTESRRLADKNYEDNRVRSCTDLVEAPDLEDETSQVQIITHSPLTHPSPSHNHSPSDFPPPPPLECDRSNTSSPQLVSPSLCDIDDLTPTAETNDPTFLSDNQIKRRPIIIQDDDDAASEFFESPVVAREVRNMSPTGISELLYQNSELSIQSQEFYAPPDNDLNIILAKNLNFEISEDEEDDDEAANCSKDYLLDGDPLNDSGSIDELYQQIKRNANWRRKNEDYVNENSSNGSGSSQCLSRLNNCNSEPLDVINDN